MNAMNAAKIVGGILIVFGLFATSIAWSIEADAQGDVGARIFPLMATVSISILGFLEFRRGFETDAPALAVGAKLSSIFVLLALALIYAWGLSVFGYLLSTACITPLVMWLFGIRSPVCLLLATVLCPLVYHLLFFELLGVFPPYGEWFDLLYLLEEAS